LRISGIGRVRARSLFNGGITSMKDILEADEKHIARVPNIGATMARRIKKETVKFV
jgi:helicase